MDGLKVWRDEQQTRERNKKLTSEGSRTWTRRMSKESSSSHPSPVLQNVPASSFPPDVFDVSKEAGCNSKCYLTGDF